MPKIIVNHMNLANNFGKIDIKDVSGKLNIGKSYEGDISKLVNEKISNKVKVFSKLQKK